MTKFSPNVSVPSPVQNLNDPLLESYGITVDVKRDDLIHPVISGNKYRKLAGHLAQINKTPGQGVVTMGGPWSNHLHATAWLCAAKNWPCTVLVRGHKPKRLSAMLTDLETWGTNIVFISRADYRELREAYEAGHHSQTPLMAPYQSCYFIPEGGYHMNARSGINSLIDELEQEYDAVYLGIGTATTLGGLVAGWKESKTHFWGIQAVDATESQKANINRLAPNSICKFSLTPDYQFGGFARTTEQLIEFMCQCYKRTELVLEPIYTAKAMFALYEHIQQGMYSNGQRLLFIHTGGLQGLRGYEDDRLKTLATVAGY